MVLKHLIKEDSEQADLFGQGKAAMTIIYYNEKSNYKFKWGAVLPPVSSLQKDAAPIFIYLIRWRFGQEQIIQDGVENDLANDK